VQFTRRFGDQTHRRVHGDRSFQCAFRTPPCASEALQLNPLSPENWNPGHAVCAWARDYQRAFTEVHRESIAARAARCLEMGGYRLSIAALAREVGCSVAVLHRRFAEDNATTVAEYRARVRTRVVIIRLRESDDKLQTISSDVGWRSKKGLYHALHTLVGITPTAVRRLPARAVLELQARLDVSSAGTRAR
jgi:AraC-like DNA-binding protein